MKKVLVHLHIYYRDQTDYFIGKLSNICGCEWDLYVTMTEPDDTTVGKIRHFKEDTRFIVTENVGYDIWPFIKVLKAVNLDDYDYILKLHTKNRNETVNLINGLGLKDYQWRDNLVDPLLKKKKSFLKCLEYFRKYPDIGLICSHLQYKKISGGLTEDLTALDNELKRLGLNVKDKKFCAGTMFIARSAPYKRFQNDTLINEHIFSTGMASHSIGSISHIYERILTITVNAAGYTVKPIVTNWVLSLYIIRSPSLLVSGFAKIRVF